MKKILYTFFFIVIAIGISIIGSKVFGSALEIAHYKMNDNAASTTVLDATGSYNGTAQHYTGTGGPFTMNTMSGAGDQAVLSGPGEVGQGQLDGTNLNLTYLDGGSVNYTVAIESLAAGSTIRIYGTLGNSDPIDLTVTVDHLDTPRATDIQIFTVENTVPALVGGSYTIDITPAAGGLTTSGKISSALDFNGSNDYVSSTSAVDASLLGSNSRSMTAWVYLNSANTSMLNVIGYGKDDSSSQFGLGFDGSTNLNFWGGGNDFASTLAVSQSTWTFVAVTYDGTTVRLYRNADTQSSAKSLDTHSSKFYIGCESIDDTSCRNYFNGKVDDVRVYDFVLTTDQLNTIYNSGSGTEDALSSSSSTNFMFYFY